MPDIRQHRGPHPEDRKLFAVDQLPKLRVAVSELSWLLTRDYAMKSALKLVGDRYELSERQRLAVSRAACSNQSKERRTTRSVLETDVSGADLIIDGFNLIVTVEAALSGGVIIRGRDGWWRDLSGVHGSYRAVSETIPAISLVGESLASLQPSFVRWLLDRPISNSGRLAKRIRDLAEVNHWNWGVDVVFNPDAEMVASNGIVISSDSFVLDQADRLLNLNSHLIEKVLADPWLIDLS